MYRWKSSFHEEEGDRPEKPRRYGVTEMRAPNFTFLTHDLLQDTFESMGQFVDGLKFTGGSNSLMPKCFIKDVTDMAHKHNVYVSTGDWAEHLLRKGPSGFKEYIEECTRLGFDTVEFNMGSLGFPEETLLRFIRLIKNAGLKAKPQFSVKFVKSDIPKTGNRAYGSYVVPTPQTSEMIEDMDLLIKRAERCLEAGADMIMIDADDVCKYADTVRSDIIAKVIGRLGLEKTMFEASNAKTSEWFINQYGPRFNLFETLNHQFPLFHLEDKVSFWGGGIVMNQQGSNVVTCTRKKWRGKEVNSEPKSTTKVKGRKSNGGNEKKHYIRAHNWGKES